MNELQPELRRLAHGVGITLKKMSESPALLSALGTDDPVLAIERLRTAVEALPNNEHKAGVINAFNWDQSWGASPPVSLMGRRRDYAAYRHISTDTLRRNENAAFTELTYLIRHLYG